MNIVDFQKCALQLFVVLSAVFALFTLMRIFLQFDLFDFNIYYRASQDIVVGQALYHNSAIDNNYPPTAFLFTLPMSFLPQSWAENVWTLFSVGVFGWTVWSLSRIVSPPHAKWIFALTTSLAIWAFPVKFTLGLGQINFLLLFFLGLGFLASLKGQQKWAGIWIGLAAAIKITPLLLLVYFWRKRQWQAIGWTLTSFVLLNVAAMSLVGWSTMYEYYGQVFWHIPTIGNAAYYNQSFTGLLARAQIPTDWAFLLNYSFFGGLLWLSWKNTSTIITQPTINLLEFSLYMLTILLGAGLAWQHHFVWTLLAFMPAVVLVAKLKTKHSHLIWLSLAYLLIGFNFKQPQLLPNSLTLLQSHVWLGGVILFWQTLVLLKKNRASINQKP